MEEKEKKRYFEDLKISKPVAVAIITFVAVLLGCTIFFASRHLEKEGVVGKNNGDIIEITIPETYYKYMGTNSEEAAKSYNKMGKEYCTRAKQDGGDVILRVTKKQRDNFVKMNKEKIETMLNAYYKEDSRYKFEDGDVLVYRYDEQINSMIEQKAIVGVVSLYGLNYILENNTTDWSVAVQIYNCHNDKLIKEATAPTDVVLCTLEEWKQSYKAEEVQ